MERAGDLEMCYLLIMRTASEGPSEAGLFGW